jgi:uncharacterized membrane protein YagU involved in acid resistance
MPNGRATNPSKTQLASDKNPAVLPEILMPVNSVTSTLNQLALIARIWEKTNVAPGSSGRLGMVGSAIAVPVGIPFFAFRMLAMKPWSFWRPSMRAEQKSSSAPNLSQGLLAGALGGLVASFAMSEFYSLLPRDEQYSQPDKEDSTVRAASAVSRTLFHHELTPDQKKIGGSVVHYAFGTTIAALYGVLVEFRESTRFGWGLPFGAAIWLGAHVITVPALGLSEPVTRGAHSAEAAEFAAHLVYGAVVEGLRRWLRNVSLR